MRKSWPFALAVIVVGGLAGVAIAGRPVPSDAFVLDPITAIAASTSTSVVTSTTSTADPVTTTTTVATTSAPAPVSTAPPSAPTTTAAPTTTTISGALPKDQVRLVIANGDGRFRLASATADRIRSLGYDIYLGDSLSPVDATVIYYRPGFDDEAAYAAVDIGVPDAIILAFPTNASQGVTDSDSRGDVIVVLGPDAPR
jgi:hypothetical protein